MTTEEIKNELGKIYDDARGATLSELNAIKHIGINDEKDIVLLLVEILKKGTKNEDSIKRQLAKKVKIDMGYSGIKIQFEEVKDTTLVAGKNTKFIFVCGAKGGVGKSTITINLAYALKDLGKKVGIIDSDVYGASIAKMMDVKDEPLNVDSLNKIIPFKKDGIQVISTDFFSEDEAPLLWRGSMLTSMVNNYIYQVAWSKELDFILVDLPTGTGDTLMDLAQYIPTAKCLIVSEEDKVSTVGAIKTYKSLKELNLRTIGFVLNKASGNNYAKEYLNEKCIDTEILASIPYNKFDFNDYLFKDRETKQILDDLATIVSIVE